CYDLAVVTASLGASSGLVTGDVVTVSATNGLFDDKNVGTGKDVAASVSKAGADAGNYTANTTAAAKANITAKALTISLSAENKEYDGNRNDVVTASLGASSGLVIIMLVCRVDI